ncbi:hypothetical protein TRFO_41222 [Tritrichomonas foetus]|uniref:Uncharacterized protein n=1 Tax=Tritrichomonas foetus TaxID=1144522 RepID=A0A1J4L0Z6_9EUKA|nr:hypothetical protein TRFO_41222 [Tritrichomonas foetus]|eukprot:OHT17191.1 hypothetical protein TRFO_41222 [Tritrichomonas foetus]
MKNTTKFIRKLFSQSLLDFIMHSIFQLVCLIAFKKMHELGSSGIAEFTFQLTKITHPTRTEIKTVVDEINKSPKNNISKLFWRLSRMIRLAEPAEVKAVIDPIAKLVLNNRTQYTGAAFANAHLLRVAHFISYPDGYKWCRNFAFTNNILTNAHLYNIISLPTYSNTINAQFEFLDSFNRNVQCIGASAIARHSKTPANLLRRVLATISSTPPQDVEILSLADPSSSPFYNHDNSFTLNTINTNLGNIFNLYRKRGLIILASKLASNQVGLSEYLNALMPILCRVPETDEEKSLAEEAQKLLSQIMIFNPTSFHNINNTKIFEAALVQVKANNFLPEFLQAILISFGIYSFKKFIGPLVSIWLDNLNGVGYQYIKILSPYIKYFDPQIQLQIHQAMIDRCSKNRFDTDMFMTTATILMSSHPTISPLIGKFIEVSQNTPERQRIMTKLKPVLEPKSQPILHPMREVMKVKELEKSDAFTQVNPAVKSVLINCDMSREIRNLPKPATPAAPLFKSSVTVSTQPIFKTTSTSSTNTENTLNANSKLPPKPANPSSDATQENKDVPNIDLDDDFDVDIVLDAPDSDDAED